MAKHRVGWNKQTFFRYIAEGRGQGSLSSYKPWIKIQDFASTGCVSRIKSYKVDRILHLLSKNELYYFYLLEWSDRVTDIREQYPLLDIELSTDIARRMAVKHPMNPKNGFPYVLTTDFMITLSDRYIARTIKPSSQLSNQRTLEKLEIERRYWNKKGIDWKIVTENEIPMKKVRTLEWLYCYDRALDVEMESEVMKAGLKNDWFQTKNLSAEIPHLIEEKWGLKPGTGIQVFKYLVWNKEIPLEAGLWWLDGGQI